MPLSSADITRQIMQGGYRGMGGVNNIGRSGIDFSAYPYAHGPTMTPPVAALDVPPPRQGSYMGSVPTQAPNVPIRPLTPAGETPPTAQQITGTGNPFAAGNWTVADQVGPAYGAELQRLGLMPANLVYNAETRTWAPPAGSVNPFTGQPT